MKVKNIYVGADSTKVEIGGGGGAGTAINASLFFDNDGNMYIKCNEGEIQEGDTVRLARYHTGKTRIVGDENTHEKYRGWIEPSPAHVAAQGLGMQITFGYSKNGSDYWEVTISHDKIAVYEDGYRFHYDDENQKSYSLQHRQGVAVYRENVRITEYLHFRVIHNEEKDTYYPSLW